MINFAGKLVRSKRIEYENIMWPRDALYISYREEKFEYIAETEAQNDTPYYCDCCDPSRQKSSKRQYSESDDEDDEENNDEDESEDEVDQDCDDENSSETSKTTENKTENNSAANNHAPKTSTQPGWFGKGRRKKARC